MPVRPPKRNVTRNPTVHSIGVAMVILPRHMVPIQLKNFTPVGTAMSIVMNEKKGSRTAPVTYMWWAHTVTESAAIAIVANTSPWYPKSGFLLKTGMISVMMPKNGSAMM